MANLDAPHRKKITNTLKRLRTILLLFVLFIFFYFLLYPTPYEIEKDNSFTLSEHTSSSISHSMDLFLNTNFKKNPFIYIYPLPSQYNSDIVDHNPKCLSSIFSSEIYFHRQLSVSQYITNNISEALFFFLPVYSSCFLTMERKNERDQHINPHLHQVKIVTETIEWVKSRYPNQWNLHGGRDHFIILNHDFGRCLTYKEPRDMLKYSKTVPSFEDLNNMMVLSSNSDLTSPCYRFHQDIVIPPYANQEIFLAPENLPDYYKIYSNHYHNRSILIYFRGTVDFKWFNTNSDPHYSHQVRQKIYDHFLQSPRSDVKIYSNPATSILSYLSELTNSEFCICPRGHANWSPRYISSILTGCIPVFISDNSEYPFSDKLNYNDFSIQIAENQVYQIYQILSNIPIKLREQMRINLRKICPSFFWSEIPSPFEWCNPSGYNIEMKVNIKNRIDCFITNKLDLDITRKMNIEN